MSINAQIVSNDDHILADFGEAQVWTPAGGAAVPFTGIADVSSQLIELNAGSIVSSDARVIGKRSVIGAAKKGDAITLTSALNGISAAAYTVVVAYEHDPETGPGMTRLELRKSP